MPGKEPVVALDLLNGASPFGDVPGVRLSRALPARTARSSRGPAVTARARWLRPCACGKTASLLCPDLGRPLFISPPRRRGTTSDPAQTRERDSITVIALPGAGEPDGGLTYTELPRPRPPRRS